MKTKDLHRRRCAGATLPEVLMAAAVASIVLGGLMMGSVALQRSFSASDQLARAQADLLRVSDYIARDIRCAKSVNTTATGSVLLTVTKEDYFDRKGTPTNFKDDVPHSPVLGRTSATYGTQPVTIRYLRSGNSINREVTQFDSGAANISTTRIADTVDNLSVTLDSQGAATVTASTATRYARRKTGAPSPAISIVMPSKILNPYP